MGALSTFWQNNKTMIFFLTGFAGLHVGWLALQYDEKLVSPEDRKKLPLGLGNISWLERNKSNPEGGNK